MSVISRMLQDLESRGAGVPVKRPASAPEVKTSIKPGAQQRENDARAWLRTMLLSSGLLAGVVGVYTVPMPAWLMVPDAPVATKAQAVATATPTQSKTPVADAVASAWHLDWALSLGLIKPRVALSAKQASTQVSLSPNQDMSEGEPPHVDAKLTNLDNLSPPAAGRVQTTANQSVEAYRRALDLIEQGRDAVALDAALLAVKLDAQHLPARRLAVALALDQKQVDQASVLIDEGLQQDPHDSELLILHARRLAVAGANDQALVVLQGLERPNGEALGLKAGLLARTGRYASAATAYEQALKTKPNNATWWLGLGVAWNAQGQSAMAKEAFIRARKLGQLSPDVQAWLDQQL